VNNVGLTLYSVIGAVTNLNMLYIIKCIVVDRCNICWQEFFESAV